MAAASTPATQWSMPTTATVSASLECARDYFCLQASLKLNRQRAPGPQSSPASLSIRKDDSMNRKTRVILADDHPIVLNGLRNLVQAQDDLDLVGEASSGISALNLIRSTSPDVAVVDISMPDLNGIALTRRLAGEMPSVQVLVLTLHEDLAFVRQALQAGVRGYVLKRSAAEFLIQAIRAVVIGSVCVDPAIASRMIRAAPRGRHDISA